MSRPARERLVRDTPSFSPLPWWQPMLFGAMAGGMGWGIRGQYGHETGAMIAGLLVGLVLVFLCCPHALSLPAARAVAWCTVAIGFGGSMTYGQTIGLTHDAPLIGNWAALRWGLLGLAIKGGIWVGFAGVFLGMGLGGVRYRPRELLLVMVGLLALFFLGVSLLNSPFDPSQKVLPKIYFSDDWHWEPNADLKPRREVWGGLLFALIGLLFFTRGMRRDRLPCRLGLWAVLGGALGFPLGQSLQAFHAWNLDLFRMGWLARLDSHLNWWNMMETTFGAVFGAVLGLGLWINRPLIAKLDEPSHVPWKPGVEWLLCAVHVTLLVASEFSSASVMGVYTEYSLVLGIIPVVAIAGGRWWPYLLALPITVLPIVGKTVRQLCYKESTLPPQLGWVLYLLLPLAVTTAAAVWFARSAQTGQTARSYTRWCLLGVTWIYFSLNFAFFHFPWPWSAWTSRTPNGIIYTLCALGLTLAALFAKGSDRVQGRQEAGRSAGLGGLLEGVSDAD